MTAIEVSLLHYVSHWERKKKLAEFCFVLNIRDTHVATYALKKLVARGYIKSEKTGKEACFFATAAGRELCGKISLGARAVPYRYGYGKRARQRADRRRRRS